MRMNRRVVRFVLLAATILANNCYAIDSPPTPPDSDNFLIFLLAGQSNMAGRGKITEQDREIHPRILMQARDGSWQYAVDPVHYDKKRAGAGSARVKR